MAAQSRSLSIRLGYLSVMGLVVTLALGGCASSPGAKLSAASQWQRVSEDVYSNTQSGQQITRDEYSELVAQEVFARTYQSNGNRNAFCR